MKKLIAIMAIAGFMVACNSNSESEKTTSDTSSTNTDTSMNKMVDTSMNKMVDTSMKTTDTTNKMQKK
jgi:hypothetical protein